MGVKSAQQIYNETRADRFNTQNLPPILTKSNCFRSTAIIQRANNLTAYTFAASPESGDQYGATMLLENFGTTNSFVLLLGIEITMNIVTPIPATLGAAKLYLFSETPSPARGDNDAFALPLGDSNSCLTKDGIPFTFRAATGGGSCVAVVNDIRRLMFVPATGNVFACIVLGTALIPNAANESGVLTTITLEA